MTRLHFEMINAIDNAYNEFKYQHRISKIYADDLILVHSKTSSIDFWNYVQKVGDISFRNAVEKALSH